MGCANAFATACACACVCAIVCASTCATTRTRTRARLLLSYSFCPRHPGLFEVVQQQVENLLGRTSVKTNNKEQLTLPKISALHSHRAIAGAVLPLATMPVPVPSMICSCAVARASTRVYCARACAYVRECACVSVWACACRRLCVRRIATLPDRN